MYAKGWRREPGWHGTERKAGDGTHRELPRHVRFFPRRSRKGLPAPACAVALERGFRSRCDGTLLIADQYLPPPGGPWPTLLVRTPYGRGFPWDYMYGALFAEQGFHVVIQSCRGTGGSGGSSSRS